MCRFAPLIIVACTLCSRSLASNSQTTTPGTVYLTFDDGPIDATLGVLDVLQETKTKATFFVNGFHLAGEGDENEDRSLEALRRIVKQGHVLANHGVNHMLHNCCDESGDCGAQVCNRIQEWNIQSYQNVEIDAATFPENTNYIAQPEFLGEAQTPITLAQFARLPYTNAWRLRRSPDSATTYLSIDCPCCTSDDLAPWDPAFTCSLEAPTQSATLASLVADRLLEMEGFDAVLGWDIEWGPENWGNQDPASTLTSAQDLFLQVAELLHNSASTAQTQDQTMARLVPATSSYCTEENLSECEGLARLRAGKVVILTHEFLFEDGRRGQGATNNLPKLKEFIELLQAYGYLLDTMDNYLQSTGLTDSSEDIVVEDEVSSGGQSYQCIWLLPSLSLLLYALTN